MKCACQCGGTIRTNKRNRGKRGTQRFISGHSLETARLWRGKGKPDTRKGGKSNDLIIYKDDARVETPTPSETKEPPAVWSAKPDEWYEAHFEKEILGGILFRLTNGDLCYAHRSVMPPNFRGPLASVRIERSDRGVRWRALQVLP